MSFYDTADFIDAFRNGGCFIFEQKETDNSDESQSEETKGDPDATVDGAEDTSVENVEDNEAATNTKESSDNQDNKSDPLDTSDMPETSDEVKSNTADDVNADSTTKAQPHLNGDQIAKVMDKNGITKQILTYGVTSIEGNLMESVNRKKKITLRMLLPYVKAGVESFCQKMPFKASVKDMADAVMNILNSIDAAKVQKEKIKQANAEKQAQQQQQQTKKPNDSGSEKSGGNDEASGGGEEAPAPDDGDTPPEE